jgi:hypothetical protein
MVVAPAAQGFFEGIASEADRAHVATHTNVNKHRRFESSPALCGIDNTD